MENPRRPASDKYPGEGIRVLVIDDDPNLADSIQEGLERKGYECVVANSSSEGVRLMERDEPNVILTDLKLDEMDGMAILRKAKKEFPDTEVLVITGHGDVQTAVEAMRAGAANFLEKPIKLEELRTMVERASQRFRLNRDNRLLKQQLEEKFGFEGLIGNSPKLLDVINKLKNIAPTSASVLVQGETGTGKDLIAKAIHNNSPRKHKHFVAMNCTAINENLLDDELFGHEAGAFTGADKLRKGRFEYANGGTLFLDEVGELNKNIQVKLLRFLESGEIRRVGDTEPFRVDVRVLCATNRDLREMIKTDDFREDLYFRVNTFEIRLPPLRERRQDIPELARHLLGRAARRPIDQVSHLLSPEAIDMLLEYHWQGNVREMANVMEHAYILSGGGPITPEHLPHTLRASGAGPVTLSFPTAAKLALSPSSASSSALPKTLKEIEKEHILRVLDKYNGNKAAASSELGIVLKTLYNKLNLWEEEDRQKHVG